MRGADWILPSRTIASCFPIFDSVVAPEFLGAVRIEVKNYCGRPFSSREGKGALQVSPETAATRSTT